jgi:hypothetical protein
VQYVLTFLDVTTALFAAGAAVLWYKSSVVKTPKNFAIHVAKPNHGGPLGGPLGGTYVGHGYSQELQQLGEALVRQSRLSAQAALCATASAILQAMALVLRMTV